MTSQEFTDNLVFLSALNIMESLIGLHLINDQELAKAKQELSKSLRPTIAVKD